MKHLQFIRDHRRPVRRRPSVVRPIAVTDRVTLISVTPAIERRCGTCAGVLHARSNAAYCSSACRQRAYRQRSTGRPRPVDVLIAELASIVGELERHGLDHDGAHYGDALEALEFSYGANKAIGGLIHRLTTVKGCLAEEERRRHHWAAMQAVATEDLVGMERHLAAWRAVGDD